MGSLHHADPARDHLRLTPLMDNNVLGQLRNNLTLPYVLLLLATICVFVLLFFSANRLNEYSIQSSKYLFQSVINNEIESLGKWAKDYSYWNDAVDRIILNPDEEFINENLLGPYLFDTFSISRIIIMDVDRTLRMSVFEGERDSVIPMDTTGPEIQTLVNRAMDSDMNDPAPATGILWIDDSVYLVAAAVITPYETTATMDVEKAYGFLIFARRLNNDLLQDWTQAYQFQQLKIHTNPDTPGDDAVNHTLESPLGRWIMDISWQPEQPGKRFLAEMIPWVLGLFALMLIVSVIFVTRVQRYARLTEATMNELRQSRQQLNNLAYYDAITGLPNRSLAMDRLQQAIAASRRLGVLTAVLYIDLDGFKHINDTRGHEAGDQLLRMVGQRMQSCIREKDTAARMGGDEFCIILQELSHLDAAEIIANKLQDAMTQPFIIDGHEMYISASTGIIIAPTDGTDPTQLLQHADIAMYQAKHRGRNCYQYFTTELNDRIQNQAVMQSSLRNALQSNEFSLAYQPITHITRNRIVGAEVLLRWNNKELGKISPSNFIPLAESSGMIVSIGEWVLRKALEDAKDFYHQYGDDFFLSINISGRQLTDRHLVDLIRNIYFEKSASLPGLHLEITEGYLIENETESRAILNEISAMGVKISIDDFGTGYSSLSYIHRFPIDTLKIDQSFVHQIHVQAKVASLVIAIISISKSLQLSVIAEGVETEEQYQFLQKHGCELVQGYYLTRPMSKPQFIATILQDKNTGSSN